LVSFTETIPDQVIEWLTTHDARLLAQVQVEVVMNFMDLVGNEFDWKREDAFETSMYSM
jgi:hypothetical protein